MPIHTLEEAFQVLGIASNSSDEEIKKAYKKLALKTHPDKNPDDPDAHKKFLLISEAYKRITDPDSFREEDEAEPSEEEMEAMFNMMFAEMMGLQGFECGGIPFEMFEMFDAMMDGGDFDEDEDDDEDDLEMFNRAAEFFGAAGMHGMPWEGGNFGDLEDSYSRQGGSLQNQLESLLMAEIMEAEGRSRGKGKSKAKKSAPGAKSSHSKPASASTSTGPKKAATKRDSHDGRSGKKEQPVAGKEKGVHREEEGGEEDDDEDEEWESASSDEDEPAVASSTRGSNPSGRGGKSRSSKQRGQEVDDEALLAYMMNEMNLNLGRGRGGMTEKQMMDLMLGMVMDAGMLEGDSEDDSEEDGGLHYYGGGGRGGRDHGAGAGKGARGPARGPTTSRTAAHGGVKPSVAENQGPKQAAKSRTKASSAKGPLAATASSPTLPSHSAGASAPSMSTSSSSKGSQPQTSGKSAPIGQSKPTPAPTSRISQTGKRSTQGTEASTEEFFEESASAAAGPASLSASQPFAVGDRVKVNNRHTGTVAYVGSVHYAKGVYVGVVMDDPTAGKNTGTLKGVTYFRCPPEKKALVVTVSEVARL